MDTMKVLIGGVVAGVIFFASDLGWHLLFGSRMAADMAAAGLTEPALTTTAIAITIALNLLFGVALVWLYAAIRPRFGPGMRTASYAAVFVWLLGTIMATGWVWLGIMSLSSFGIMMVWYLVFTLLAAWAGGRLYSETAPARVGVPA
jgi:hypothetical protein